MSLYSNSKTFAAAILMKLVEEGRLDLEVAMVDILKNADFTYDVGTINGYANVCKKIKEFIGRTTRPDSGQTSKVLSKRSWRRFRALGLPG